VHRLAYLAWPTAFWHAVTARNDLRIWWVALVLWGCTAAVGTAVITRLLSWLRGPAWPDGRSRDRHPVGGHPAPGCCTRTRPA